MRDEVGDSLTMIQYHTSGDFQNEVGKGRARYYDIMGLPKDVCVDGKHIGSVDYDDVRSKFDERKNLPPEIEITLSKQYSTSTGEGTVTAHIKNVSSKDNIDGTCHFAICQRDSAHEWGSPYNEDTCYAICFMMLPDYNGTSISVAADEIKEITQSFTIESSWQRDDCYLIVFVQKSDKEIIQAVEIPLDDATDTKEYSKKQLPDKQVIQFVEMSSNPANEYLTVSLNYDNAEVSIVNCAGIVAKRKSISHRYLRIPLNDLSAGIYLCVVKMDNRIEKKRFIKF